MQASWPDALFTDSFRQKARRSRVLLIGAGGIGCEVLKTLVLTGYRNITLVDLDIIETSNLNRQFLFRASHIGRSKAKTAAEVVERMLPSHAHESASHTNHSRKKQRQSLFASGSSSKDSKRHKGSSKRDRHLCITPFHADIKDPMFNVDFYKGFDIVLNGLDNLAARLHVNRLCFAAEVPLVESGTTGYEGSVTVHIKEQSHCYECEEKPVSKSFPICTIRNTPDKLIHCVVWAKDLLFARLFGRVDVTSDLDEELKSDVPKEQRQMTSFFVKGQDEAINDYAIRIFRRVFQTDIISVCEMKELWKNRLSPSLIQWPSNEEGPCSLDASDIDIYKVLSEEENRKLFISAIVSIHETRSDEIGELVFDKDDELSVQFVAAAANLRAICYSITSSSIFEIKGMAGNIVHAIATTNATVAGLVVTEACKIISGCGHTVKETFVGKHCLHAGLTRKRDVLIKSTLPPKKNPACVVCGRSIINVGLNTDTMTFGRFVDKVIKSKLGITAPTLIRENFMYEEGEGLEEDEVEEYMALLTKRISELPGNGWKSGAVVQVSSQVQQLACRIVISHREDIDADTIPDEFILTGSLDEESVEEGDPEKAPKRKREDMDAQETAGETEEPFETIDLDLLDDLTEGDGEVSEFVSKRKKKRTEDVQHDD